MRSLLRRMIVVRSQKYTGTVPVIGGGHLVGMDGGGLDDIVVVLGAVDLTPQLERRLLALGL